MAQTRLNIDGMWYTNGQTAYLDCGKGNVDVYIDAIPYGDPSAPTLAPLYTQTSSNFSTSDAQSDIQKILNLDSNHQDGFIKATISDFNPGDYITINITQRPPAPSLTSVPTICDGQTGTLSAQVNYSYQNTNPVSLIWQGAGGVTINGGSTYTLNNSTSGSATVQLSSPRGTAQVYATIPGCGNLQSSPSALAYFGSPQIDNLTVDNVVNPGPYAVNSGSTHYFSTTSAFNYVPSYSINSITNSGDIALNLTGLNGGSGQINVSGSTGNATLHITASNTCGSDSRDAIFYIPSYYRASPNPAKSNLIIAFDNTDYKYALPDQLEIVSEKKQNVVRTINVQDAFQKKTFKNGREINFDISSLERGTYYLRVINPRQTESRKVEMIRLIFE
jgi:hypothetical protein